MKKTTETELVGEFLPSNTDYKKTQKFTWLASVPDLCPVRFAQNTRAKRFLVRGSGTFFFLWDEEIFVVLLILSSVLREFLGTFLCVWLDL